MGEECDVSLVTLGHREYVRAGHGLAVGVDGRLTDVDPQLLVVPRDGWSDGGGVRDVVDAGTLPEVVAELHAGGNEGASVCTGAMVLSTAYLLDGRPAATHAVTEDDLRATGADLQTARAVDAGDVLTSGGVRSGLDLAFHVVRKAFGGEVADRVAREIEYEPSSDVYLA